MDAIENASEGDKIIICKGKYKEYITIDLPISIYGINRPIIHGMYNQSILTIFSNYVNIRNLLFCYSGGKNNDAGVNNTITNTIYSSTPKKTINFINGKTESKKK